MKTILKNQKGFSLIELLAVVAIIGILAVIAIPQYDKFRAKAFQAEAKTQLATVHAAETAFFTEYNGYHSSLKVIGYAPMGRARYNIGFGSAGVTPASAPPESSFLSSKSICSGTYGAGNDTRCDMMVDTPNIMVEATTTASTYNAAALAFEPNLVVQNPTTFDVIAFMVIGTPAQAQSLQVFNSQTAVDGWFIDNRNILRKENVTYDCVTAGSCAISIIEVQ